MNVLDRQKLQSELDLYRTGQRSATALANWAFDQFYAQAEGALVYEPGYGAVLRNMLDDLMFSDDPRFELTQDHVRQMIDQLAMATYNPAAANDHDHGGDDDDDE